MPNLKHSPVSAATELPHYLLIWRNPGSTNNQKADTIIADLKASGMFKDILVIETEHRKYKQNQKRLLQALRQTGGDAWIAIAGGDGTIGAAVNALKDSGITMPTLLPLPTGNSNDIATMLHGKKRVSPRNLSRAHVVPVHTLSCKLTADDGTTLTRDAIAYIGFGITGQSAQIINAPTHRNHSTRPNLSHLHRRMREIRRFADVLQQAVPFTIQEKGDTKVLFERIITNGQRMAKYFHWPVELSEEAFHDIVVEQLGPMRTGKDLIRMTRGKEPGNRTSSNDTISFTVLTPVLAQLDGETLQIPTGTTVTISHSRTPLHFVGLR